MPWNLIQLNDGYAIPSIAFGTWTLGNGQGPHIDTAQVYGNEEEVGRALRESGLAREDVYITTKYWGVDGLDIGTSLHDSLKKLGVEYVDLYLIHHPRLARPDIPTAWAEMEAIKQAGLAKSIGVSNFGVDDLAVLLASAKIKPAANQILLHPYVYASQAPLLEYDAAQGIVTEAYSALIPITHRPGGPVDRPVNEIARRLNATADQVLLAWVKAKGAVAVTTSSKKSRLEGYLAAADLELTPADVAAIDAAGAKGSRRDAFVKTVRAMAELMLLGAVMFRIYAYLA
ncbi:Aldo/keto reductase [Russula brevipes]|nr:Aldo/keto reductase [Russula brevipes]